MIWDSSILLVNLMNSPVRTIRARVEVFNASTLLYTFLAEDRLIDYSIERVSEEGLFFGFGICQKLNVKLIDTNKEISVSPGYKVRVSYSDGRRTWAYPHPDFYITQSRRDEVSNVLTLYGYDAIFDSSKMIVKNMNIAPFWEATISQWNSTEPQPLATWNNAEAKPLINEDGVSIPYTIRELARYIAHSIGAVDIQIERVEDTSPFDLSYPEGANLDGSENLREVLDDIAEATQTIYFMDRNGYLVFKRLDKNIEADWTIQRDNYFTLDSNGGRRLQTIANVTELGENVSASTQHTGSTQYIRDNCFWDLRSGEVSGYLDKALAAVGDLSIAQFVCEWQGHCLVELGDKIDIETREGKKITSFLLNDTITYNGAYSQTTEWKYDENSAEDETNPSSLGDALKQTFAKVDKANKRIDLVVQDTEDKISQIEINANNINASVSKMEQHIAESAENTNQEIQNLTAKVEATMSADAVKLEIKKELNNGVDKVTTSRGFTFDDSGLNISKQDSEMETLISEDGMKITRSGSEVLVANNTGVDAENLHATTYLIIGNNSRFEDYGSRTGCFYING